MFKVKSPAGIKIDKGSVGTACGRVLLDLMGWRTAVKPVFRI